MYNTVFTIFSSVSDCNDVHVNKRKGPYKTALIYKNLKKNSNKLVQCVNHFNSTCDLHVDCTVIRKYLTW